MLSEGLSALKVSGFAGMIMLPWGLKVIVAPIMDRVTFISMGRRRPWVITGLTFASLGYVAMGLISDPLNHFTSFMIAGMVASGCTALMDVAVDGMAVEIVPSEEQTQANGLMWGGKVFGTAITAWVSGVLFKQTGISWTLYAAGFATLVFALIPLLIRERPGEKLLPWTEGAPSKQALQNQQASWATILKNLWRVITLPASGIMILLIVFAGATQGLFDAFAPIWTVEQLGWESEAYSRWAAISTFVAGGLGMILGGWLVLRFGYKRALASYLVVLAFASITMAVLPDLGNKDTMMMIHHSCRTLALVTCFSIGMALSWKPIAATQFACYMTFGNLGISSGSFDGAAFPNNRLHSYLPRLGGARNHRSCHCSGPEPGLPQGAANILQKLIFEGSQRFARFLLVKASFDFIMRLR